MPIDYSTTSQTTATQGAKLAIYGVSGAGKTSIIATAPDPFIVAIEPGLIALKKPNVERMYGVGTAGISYDIQVANVRRDPTVSICWELQQLYTLFASGVDWTRRYKTLAFDTASQLAEYELLYQLTQTTNGQRAYGQMADNVLEVIRLFNSLHNLNIVWLVKQSISSHSGLFSASFPGQLLDFHFPHEFDAVLQLTQTEAVSGQVAQRFLRTSSDHRHFAKDRTGMLATQGEPPYLYNIFSKISAA